MHDYIDLSTQINSFDDFCAHLPISPELGSQESARPAQDTAAGPDLLSSFTAPHHSSTHSHSSFLRKCAASVSLPKHSALLLLPQPRPTEAKQPQIAPTCSPRGLGWTGSSRLTWRHERPPRGLPLHLTRVQVGQTLCEIMCWLLESIKVGYSAPEDFPHHLLHSPEHLHQECRAGSVGNRHKPLPCRPRSAAPSSPLSTAGI